MKYELAKLCHSKFRVSNIDYLSWTYRQQILKLVRAADTYTAGEAACIGCAVTL